MSINYRSRTKSQMALEHFSARSRFLSAPSCPRVWYFNRRWYHIGGLPPRLYYWSSSRFFEKVSWSARAVSEVDGRAAAVCWRPTSSPPTYRYCRALHRGGGGGDAPPARVPAAAATPPTPSPLASVCLYLLRQWRWHGRRQSPPPPSLTPPARTSHGAGGAVAVAAPFPSPPPAVPASTAHGCCVTAADAPAALCRPRRPRPVSPIPFGAWHHRQ